MERNIGKLILRHNNMCNRLLLLNPMLDEVKGNYQIGL